MKAQFFALYGRSAAVYHRSAAGPMLVFLHTNALGVKVYLPLCPETTRAGYRLLAAAE